MLSQIYEISFLSTLSIMHMLEPGPLQHNLINVSRRRSPLPAHNSAPQSARPWPSPHRWWTPRWRGWQGGRHGGMGGGGECNDGEGGTGEGGAGVDGGGVDSDGDGGDGDGAAAAAAAARAAAAVTAAAAAQDAVCPGKQSAWWSESSHSRHQCALSPRAAGAGPCHHPPREEHEVVTAWREEHEVVTALQGLACQVATNVAAAHAVAARVNDTAIADAASRSSTTQVALL